MTCNERGIGQRSSHHLRVMPNRTEEQQTLTEFRAAALTSKAWPFEEARKLLERYKSGAPAKGHVLFETGYGPSGLPHIGTFGEVARTTMVRRAYEILSDMPPRLLAFSDDMDGQIGRASCRERVC